MVNNANSKLPQEWVFIIFNRQLVFLSVTNNNNNSYNTTVQLWQAAILAIKGVMETFSKRHYKCKISI